MRRLRKRIFRSVAMATLPFIVSLYIRLIYATSKINFHLPQNIPDEPMIIAFWHGDLLMQSFIYKKVRRKPKVKMMISGHFDGQLIAKTISYLGFESIFSDKKKPTQLIFQALRAIKNGYDVGITPDGPRGPRHEVSDGIVMLAQKMKAPVLFFQCVPSQYRQVKSWDRFVVPKLFTTLDFYASEAVRIDSVSPEEGKEIIKEGLMQHAF